MNSGNFYLALAIITSTCTPPSLFLHSDFIWDFEKLPFPTHLGKYYIKIGKKRAKIHEIGKIKAIF